MKNETYNGWTNRETWLVNLYYGEGLQEYTNEYIQDNEEADNYAVSKYLGSILDDLLEEEMSKLSGFLADFIDLGRIDWHELTEVYLSEAKENANE